MNIIFRFELFNDAIESLLQLSTIYGCRVELEKFKSCLPGAWIKVLHDIGSWCTFHSHTTWETANYLPYACE